MRIALAILAAGIIAFGVYKFTNQTDLGDIYAEEHGQLSAKVQSSQIYPKSVFTGSMLQIKMTAGTPDDYKYLQVKWYRNGTEIPRHAGPQLPSSTFHKGDEVYAAVNLIGPEALAEPVITAAVKVENSPPAISSGSVFMLDQQYFLARVNASDADRDKITYKYIWFINNREIAGESTDKLPVSYAESGDKVVAQVVASDGEIESAAFSCDALQVEGRAPQITSNPPTALDGNRFVYQITTNRTDLSSLTFELLDGPNDMTITEAGKIEWEVPISEDERNIKVSVLVSADDGGETTHSFGLSLKPNYVDQ